MLKVCVLILGFLIFGQSISFAASLDKARLLLLSGDLQAAEAEVKTFLSEVKSPSERSLALFFSGSIYLQQGEFELAREFLEKTLAAQTNLGAYAFYRLAKAYDGLGRGRDAEMALEKMGLFKPPSELKYRARYLLAEMALKKANFAEAQRHLSYLKQKWRRSAEYPEVLWQLLQIQLAMKSHSPACSTARTLYSQYPFFSKVQDWGFDLQNVQVNGHRLGCLATPQNLSSRLRRLQLAGESERARKEIDEIRSSGNSRDKFRADLLLANFLTSEGYPDEALRLLLGHYAASSRDVNFLLSVAKASARAGEFQMGIGAYLRAYSLSPGSRSGREALFQAAFMSYQFQDYDSAARRFEEFSKKYPSSGLNRDARWYLAWVRYLRGDFNGALEKFTEIEARVVRTRRGRVKTREDQVVYWQAMSLLRLERFDEAAALLAGLEKSDPYSFYGLAAKARLIQIPANKGLAPRVLAEAPPILAQDEDKIDAPSTDENIVDSEVELAEQPVDSDEDEPIEVSEVQNPELKRRFEIASALSKVGDWDWARQELYEIERRSRNPDYLKNLIKAYEGISSYHRAVSIAENIFVGERRSRGVNGAKSLWETAFPRAYLNLVERYSGQFALPADLAWAIMKAESQFKADVESPVGAKGLMQIMPETGRQVARLLGDTREFQAAELMNPEVNIRIGTRYLSRLSQKFASSVPLVAAGYNAGPHRVELWLSNFGHLDVDEFIEHIPFVETRNYAKKVVRYQSMYRLLYSGDEKPLKWLSSSIPVRLNGRPSPREIW